MLIAEDETEKLVTAILARRGSKYRCPGCHCPVRLKRGTVMCAHFAHQANQACTTFSEGETAEHLLGKQQLAAWFAASGYTVTLEARLPTIHQRPDVLVQLGKQPPLALEFQCSPISVEKLRQRTQGYRDHGYRVLWLLGSPYQHQLRLNAKALKFLQHYAPWGCFLVYWLTTINGGQLLLNLTTVDGERLNYQVQAWQAAQVSVSAVLNLKTQLFAPHKIPAQFVTFQQQLVLGRLRHQPAVVSLQTYCYQHGGSLAQLPSWVFMTTPKVPILKTAYLNWMVYLLMALRVAPPRLSQQRLQTLIWQTLLPCVAQQPCLLEPNRLQAQLVAAAISELRGAKVIIRQDRDWQIVAAQLDWRAH